MLDIRRIRENLEDIKKAMDRRGEKEFDLDAVVALDDKRRELLKEVEVMKNELNVEYHHSRDGLCCSYFNSWCGTDSHLFLFCFKTSMS